MITASTTQTAAHAITNSHPSDGFMPVERPRPRRSFPRAPGSGIRSSLEWVTAEAVPGRNHAVVAPGNSQAEAVLECIECGETSAEAHGWKAYLDEEAEVLVYCVSCAEREFGE